MARSETVVTAFLASPSDVEAERAKLEDVVQELNLTWSKTLGMRLDLLRWETHAYPGVGHDAQDVINQQIGDEYDIFIGIMWGRFGSSTERADSGTEEEFRRARERHEKNPHVRIMFYFKDAPIAPSKLDPEQLTKLQSFKRSMGEEGVFYWTFQTIEQFEGLLRMHLARQVQDFLGGSTRRVKADSPSPANDLAQPDDDEPGILDLMEVFEERFRTVNEIVTRIGAATEQLGQKMNQRTSEIKDATGAGDRDLSRSEAKRLINKAADDMNQYVMRAGAEIPILRDALSDGIHALGRAATMVVDLDEGDLAKVKEGREAVTTLEVALAGAHESVSGFRHVIHSLPRMTTMLNKAKRSTLETLDEFLQGLEDGRRDASEAGKVIDGILNKGSDA